MVFSSTVFLFAFLPVTLAGYYLIDRRFKNYFLLLASLLFYAWGEPKFVFVMIGSTLVNHFLALLTDHLIVRAESSPDREQHYRRLAKAVLTITVILNLSLFFVYKYLDFAIGNINSIAALFGAEPLPLPGILLPIGISFFTFQALSYVFDVYYRKGTVQKNPLNTMLYIALFPQLIAGPIVRYETVAEEIRNRKETLSDFTSGVKRFIIGLGKKVLISNTIAILADYCFNMPDYSQLPVVLAWLGIIAYTLQIYFDFSGYSDMAIGLGLMFGFHFSENFNYPYFSGSVSEFWRRWHISLGSWFRDYVYFPLGGSRVNSKARLLLNLFVVWLLTGVWHGASWNFVVWGLFYFVILAFEKLTGIPKRFDHTWHKVLYRIFTLLAVMLGWVVFRAPDLSGGLSYIGSMFGLNGNAVFSCTTGVQIQNYILLIIVAAVLSVPVIPKLRQLAEKRQGSNAVYITAESLLLIVILLVSVSFCTISAYDPFIYFNF